MAERGWIDRQPEAQGHWILQISSADTSPEAGEWFRKRSSLRLLHEAMKETYTNFAAKVPRTRINYSSTVKLSSREICMHFFCSFMLQSVVWHFSLPRSFEPALVTLSSTPAFEAISTVGVWTLCNVSEVAHSTHWILSADKASFMFLKNALHFRFGSMATELLKSSCCAVFAFNVTFFSMVIFLVVIKGKWIN